MGIKGVRRWPEVDENEGIVLEVKVQKKECSFVGVQKEE